MERNDQNIRKVTEVFTNTITSLNFIHKYCEDDDIRDSKNILHIDITIEDEYEELNSMQVDQLNNMFKTKSILIDLKPKDGTKFHIFWKSSKIEQLLLLKCIKNNQSGVREFVVNFLAKSIENGHLGILNIHNIIDNEVQFHDLVDSRGYNLLLIACESGITAPIRFLISCEVPTKMPNNDEVSAQNLAQQGKHSNVLLKLLQENLTFPSNLDINECSDDFKIFIEMSIEFHKMIKVKNEEKLAEIIKQNPNLRYFYNLSNKSALNVALDNEFVDIYEFLISKNLCFGPNENSAGIIQLLGPRDKKLVHKIHLKYTKSLPSKHINIIMTNTTLTHDETDGEGKRQIVLRAYQILNEEPLLEIILKAVAAAKDFHIVFDFFKDSTLRFDPWTSEGTKGIFYFNGQITIGAKQLLDEKTENEVLGTLAHELCHFAVFAAYENNAKPYKPNDQQAEKDLSKIIEICEKNKNNEKYISLVYDCYEENQRPAELIVRPAHLIALYYREPEILIERKEKFPELFNHFENVVIPAINGSIASIESRLVYKSTQTFGELSVQKQNDVKNSMILYKNIKIKLNNLVLDNINFYEKLTPEHISQLLDGKVLDLDDRELRHLDEFVILKWENLSIKLKKEILDSTAIFKGQYVTLKNLNFKYPEVLNFLTSEQLKVILDGTKIIIGEKILSNLKFYAERKFIPEDLKLILLEYYYGHEYVYDDKTVADHVVNRMASKTLQEFCIEFFKQDFDTRCVILDKIRDNIEFKGHTFNLNHEDWKFLQKNSNEITEQAEKDKLLILSSEAGAGKTATFEKLAAEINEKHPFDWVSYIDLKDHTNLYESKETDESIQELLERILNLSSKNEFEQKIFKEAFKSGNVVLFWNGFDEISPNYNEFVLNLIQNIHKTTENVQYVCTRPLYSEQLSKCFKISAWQLLPFDENEKRDFFKQILVSQNIENEKIDDTIMRIVKIIDKFELGTYEFAHKFNTPFMLSLVAEAHENINHSKPPNFYQIFEIFIDKKIEIWLDRNINTRTKAKSVRLFGIIMKIYQKFAFLNELNKFSHTTLIFQLRKLQIMQNEIPKDLPIEEISRMGILYINGKNKFQFSHKTFSEFFVAQYFIENIYNVDNNIDIQEAELRLEFFFMMTKHYGSSQKMITDFMSSYIEQEESNAIQNFCPKISQLLRSKFKKIFFHMLDTNYTEVFEFMIKFFKKDSDVLMDLLNVHEDETLYTAVFNPNHFSLVIDPEKVKNLARHCLSDKDLKKFINGRNQKGRVIFGMHFYRLLDIQKVNELYQEEFDSLKDASFWEFFYKCKQYLNVDEQKELFVTASSPKIYFFYDKFFTTTDFVEYEKLWIDFENLLSQIEKQDVLGTALVHYFEMIPNNDIQYLQYFVLLLKKVQKFLLNSQIYQMFLTKNILHEAHRVEEDFETLWKFFVNHTNVDERREILLKTCERNNLFFVLYKDKMKEKFSSFQFPYFYYDFTNFNILSRSMITSKAINFNYTNQIYQESFNKYEIQQIIFDSIDLIYIAIESANELNFKKFMAFIDETFVGNEKLLKKFLEQKIKPTNLTSLELIEDFRGLPFSELRWFNNLEILNDLYEKVKNIANF